MLSVDRGAISIANIALGHVLTEKEVIVCCSIGSSIFIFNSIISYYILCSKLPLAVKAADFIKNTVNSFFLKHSVHIHLCRASSRLQMSPGTLLYDKDPTILGKRLKYPYRKCVKRLYLNQPVLFLKLKIHFILTLAGTKMYLLKILSHNLSELQELKV